MQNIHKYDIVIIGAGAAGLMCAIEAGKRGKSVLILEKNAKIGNKILISGGGRCNFTNINASPDNYISNNPHFVKSVFSRYTPKDFITLVEKHNIEYYEKTLGQLFCRKSSREIVGMLENECVEANVEIRTGIDIQSIEKPDSFHIKLNNELENDSQITCDNLVIASGGLSFPKKGATDFGYSIAEQHGLKIIEKKPGLVPLKLGESNPNLMELSGLSFEVIASLKSTKVKFRESLLITHRGVSGPAILQISSYIKRNESVYCQIMPEVNWQNYFNENLNSKSDIKLLLSKYLPQRFCEYLMESLSIGGTIKTIGNKKMELLVTTLNNWELSPIGDEGYEKAEVTLGGIDTNELNQKTMESKKVKGLYFIGEVVDVTGWLGGYNFQWAWASGYIAGNSIE